MTIQRGRGVGPKSFAVGVVGIGGKTETDAAGVALASGGVEAHEASGAAEEQDEYAGSQGIESAEMADLAETGDTTYGFNDVM